jgi:hypothetical protein
MENMANIVNRNVGPELNRNWSKFVSMIVTAGESYGVLTE